MLQESSLGKLMRFFVFGFALGSLCAVTVVREAVPLRDHAWVIGIILVAGAPICFLLYLWYKSLMRMVRNVLGEKGGNVIGAILTFQLVTGIIIFLLIVSMFFAAIA